MSKSAMPDWLKKCLTCQHYYQVKGDADEVRCKKRDGKCEYKPYKSQYMKGAIRNETGT